MGSLLQNTIFGRTKKAFISTWRTSNISSGSSNSTQVKLPLINGGTYNFIVDWGDGLSNTITTWNQAQTTHTYSVSGDYTIKITGTCVGFAFINTGDRLKLRSVSTWGKLRLGNTGSYFQGCSNLNLTAVSDILDLTGTINFTNAFAQSGVTTVNRINEWNMSSINNMTSVFANTSFNSNIGAWNVSNVTTFASMFTTSTFNNGGSSNINNWITSSATSMASMFASNAIFNQPIGNWNTSNVTTMNLMFQNCTSFNQNIGAWNVSNCTVFSNMFVGCTIFNNGGTNTINNWVLSLSPIVANSMFSGCTNFNQPLGNWNTIAITTMASMFSNAKLFNQNIGAWNVTNCTDFSNMFNGTNNFNNGGSNTINNWVLKSTGTINMSTMFQQALAFNQPIGNWSTVRVTTMASMFSGAPVFNQNIGAWNVSNVNTMASMFFTSTAFNNGLASGVSGTMTWNTLLVTDMSNMFRNATSFNQDIGGWNVSSVSNFSIMFNIASVFNNGGSSNINNWILKSTGTINCTNMFSSCPFNQPLNLWNTSRVTTMNSMFSAGSFNQDIGTWNVSNCINFQGMFSSTVNHPFNNGGSNTINNWTLSTSPINMASMFQGCLFNQPLNLWNVSTVTDMSNMFQSATNFNQPLNSWNTVNVTTMNGMFRFLNSQVAFNQDIGMWNVSKVIDFVNFMQGKTTSTFSTANLDAIYNGWSSRTVKTPITITFGTAKRTSASDAGKSILTASPNNWVITDGGI